MAGASRSPMATARRSASSSGGPSWQPMSCTNCRSTCAGRTPRAPSATSCSRICATSSGATGSTPTRSRWSARPRWPRTTRRSRNRASRSARSWMPSRLTGAAPQAGASSRTRAAAGGAAGARARETQRKPIGSFMDAEQADRRRAEGWDIIEDAGRGWRRVVASPQPLRIVELRDIRRLLDAGTVIIAVGGGGIPVAADEAGNLHGVAAVIDKDLASALLAVELGAGLFIISTAVEKVALDFGTPQQRWIDHLTLAEARQYLAEGRHFAAGSMGPKIQAVISYLEQGGTEALITDPDNLAHALAGHT